MSTAASPSRGHKRKPSEPHDTLGPSASITRGTSPFHPNHASSSTTSSPSKRQSASSSSRRNSRHTRTFQIADDLDGEEDAPYDEELDADGEDDEELLDQDAEGEDAHSLNPEHGALSPRASASTTPARRTARPKRSHAPSVSYYAAQPLPSLSDQEQDEDEKPSIRRRARKTKLLPTSDIDPDMDDDDGDDPEPAPARSSHRGTRTTTPRATKHPSGKVPRRASELDNGAPKPRSSAKPEEPEMSEEAKQLAKAEKEAEDLRSRWTEEYFEIVEQLPLEVHRTFALMRELEGQMQTRLSSMVESMTAYRDARLQMQNQIQARSDVPEQPSLPENSATQRSTNGGSEDEAENLLGGSPNGPLNGLRPSDDGDVEMLSNDGTDRSKVLDKHARQHLLQSISLAATESVKAAEEKMGLAATAYNWIDRHIRRLDADISKLESSILLGLRTGTEESRGAREALGLPVDDGASAERNGQEEQGGDDEAGEGISAEAESAALTKAAGAANRTSSSGKKETVGGRRSARTTPKMGGPAQLVSSPTRSEHARSRSRSRSRSIPASNVTTTTIAPKATSPAAATRTTRKRKPRPLSPQKGGRKSIVTSAPTLISPTTQTPSSGTTTVGPDTSEMPFDPTEPTYCYCDQISFDEMVACDNEDCSIEWFHYACVGLDAPPKNEWYCRFCAPQGWKGQGMGVPPNAKHKPPGWKKGIGIRP